MEEAGMKYINARDVLPEHLIKTLQDYIQGGYIYIPSDASRQKSWGEASGYRLELEKRNRDIILDRRNGMSAEDLSEKYHLSVYAIRKIIYRKYDK